MATRDYVNRARQSPGYRTDGGVFAPVMRGYDERDYRDACMQQKGWTQTK